MVMGKVLVIVQSKNGEERENERAREVREIKSVTRPKRKIW